MSDEREVHHEDEIDIPDGLHGVPPEQIIFVEDEAAQLFRAGEPRMGKTKMLHQYIAEMLGEGRKVELIDVKIDQELADRLASKRAEIEEQLPGWSAGPRWEMGEHRLYDDTSYGSMIQWPHEGLLKLADPEDGEFPVRVGDVIRIIDTQYGCRPVLGHVVDITGWWIYVSGPFGRKQLFFGQTGYHAGEYRWRLEPYITQEENNR
jgi:hypothetical protein